MAEKDELGGTLPSLMAKKPASSELPGEELPFEASGRFKALGEDGTEKELGRGGLGRVVVALDAHLNREVALKEMHSEILQRGGSTAHAMTERFLREARITASLEHPGVVPVYELGKRNDGSIYYAMKRVRGSTLADALAGCATLDERMSLMPHLVDVVQTLGFAHARGVAHRDLKPENVMVGPFGETQVVDWGLARAKGMAEVPPMPHGEGHEPRAAPQSASQTVAGEAMGTPRYMSPEQARGEVALMDAQSDVWSLGVMLFEVLTGRTPFLGETNAEQLAAVVSEKLPRIESLEPDAPPALVAIANRALERDRGRRFPSAVEMGEALVEALGLHPQARPAPVGWIAASVVLLALTILGVGLWRGAADSAENAQAAAKRAHEDSELALAKSIADRAQDEWEEGDVFSASNLADEALSHGKVPLARGVQTLARLSGVPKRVWSVIVPGGCAAIAARAGVVACATLGGVMLYDAEGKELGMLSTGPSGWQRAVVFLEPGVLASGGDDRAVHLWSVEKRAALGELKGAEAEIRVLAQSEVGSVIYAGLRNGQVVRWPREGGEPTVINRHQGPVRALDVGTFPIDSVLVASSGADGVRVFDGLAAPEKEPQLDRLATALKWTPSGLVVGIERDLFLLLARGRAARWSGHLDDVNALASTRSWPLVSGSSDGTLRAWADGQPVARLSGFPAPISGLSSDADATTGPDLYVATRGRTLEGWSWPRDGRSPPLPQFGLEPTAAAVAPDGTVIVGLRDASLKRLVGARNDVDIGGEHHTAPVRAVAATLHLGLSGGDDGQVLTWKDSGPARVLERLEGARVRAVALSRTGERAAWSFDDGTLVLYSLEFGKEISREKEAVVNALAFSENGATLAAGREDKQIVLLDAATGKSLRRLEGHDGSVAALAFSPDGETLASGATDKRVTLWELSTGKARAQLVAARDRIGAVAFSADSATVVAGTDEGSVFLWNAQSLELEREVRLHAGDVVTLGFGVDHRLLVVGSDRTVRALSVAE